jgi:hypothetical protein
MCFPELSLCRLRVVADADPGAIARVLERFQNLNCLPRRVVAEFSSDDTLHVEVDVAGLTEEQLATIAARVGQSPCIVNAYWHRL